MRLHHNNNTSLSKSSQQQQQRCTVVRNNHGLLLVPFLLLLLAQWLLSVAVVTMTASVTVSASASVTPSSNYHHRRHHHRQVRRSIFGVATTATTTTTSDTASTLSSSSVIPRGGAAARNDDIYDDDDDDRDDDGDDSSRSNTIRKESSFRRSNSNDNDDDDEIRQYRSLLEQQRNAIFQTTFQNEIAPLQQQIVHEQVMIPNFGTICDAILQTALTTFQQQSSATAKATKAKLPSSKVSSLYETNEADLLFSALDAPLQLLQLKLLAMIREQVMESYRTDTATAASASGSGNSKSTYDAMVKADTDFVRLAKAVTRSRRRSSNMNDDTTVVVEWEYETERTYLQSILSLAADASYKTNEIQVTSAQQQQVAMSFLQSQQQMIQQLQQQLYGQTSPWNVGMAYRIPDTNFNIQGSYQQGRSNLQLSCVPDEYAPFLGPNGFTNGVGPGNLGVSLNLSL